MFCGLQENNVPIMPTKGRCLAMCPSGEVERRKAMGSISYFESTLDSAGAAKASQRIVDPQVGPSDRASDLFCLLQFIPPPSQNLLSSFRGGPSLLRPPRPLRNAGTTATDQTPLLVTDVSPSRTWAVLLVLLIPSHCWVLSQSCTFAQYHFLKSGDFFLLGPPPYWKPKEARGGR